MPKLSAKEMELAKIHKVEVLLSEAEFQELKKKAAAECRAVNGQAKWFVLKGMKE